MGIKALELLLIAAVVFGLGFWQLYDVEKAMKDDRAEDERNRDGDSGETEKSSAREPGPNSRN